MSEMSCRWNGADSPRIVSRRHEDGCTDDECKGCLPCPEAHCRVCGRDHAEQTCVACTDDARTDLHAIAELCGNLPAEAVHRGIDSEAMTLMLPSADPEAWGHLTTSLKVGRLPVGYLVCDRCDAPWPCEKHADGELHPLFVLVTWEQVWRDALDHETDALASIGEAVRYLDAQLTYMAGYEHAPFEDFARDLRRCRAHLESVLHDGEQRDTGAPCMKCGRQLTRIWGEEEARDGWECKPCHQTSNKAQYQFAVKAEYLEKAEWLTDVDMVTRAAMEKPAIELKAGTIRKWAHDGDVAKRRHSERTEYRVDEVLARAANRPAA